MADLSRVNRIGEVQDHQNHPDEAAVLRPEIEITAIEIEMVGAPHVRVDAGCRVWRRRRRFPVRQKLRMRGVRHVVELHTPIADLPRVVEAVALLIHGQ